MDQSQSDDPAATTRILVTVVRTGGIAGLRKQWQAAPPPFEAPRWIAMIDECPWDDDVPRDRRGADRYTWRILAQRDDSRPREIEMPDSRLEGPWRVLVDHVRESAAPTRPRSATEE